MYCIQEDGWTKHYSGDMNELHYGQVPLLDPSLHLIACYLFEQYAKEKEQAQSERLERKDRDGDSKMQH